MPTKTLTILEAEEAISTAIKEFHDAVSKKDTPRIAAAVAAVGYANARHAVAGAAAHEAKGQPVAYTEADRRAHLLAANFSAEKVETMLAQARNYPAYLKAFDSAIAVSEYAMVVSVRWAAEYAVASTMGADANAGGIAEDLESRAMVLGDGLRKALADIVATHAELRKNPRG
jgi:hypothetical protein